MTINSQLNLHTRSNIVLVLVLDRPKAFQLYFSQLLGFQNQIKTTVVKRLNIYKLGLCLI